MTVFNLEGRSLTVLTLRRLAGVYVADPPVAVITDVRSLAVLTGRLNRCIGCADPPVTVCTDVRNLTCCSNAGIGLADEPVAVIANVRSLTVCTGCLNAGVSALAFTDPPVAVLADVRSQTVGCNCLVLGLFAVEVPVAICTDVVRKCILNNDHTVARFLSDEASYSKLVAILTSEVNNCLIGIAAEDLTVYGNKLGIDEYICLSCAFHKKNELLTVCINYAIGYIKSCISINANYCCLTCHANDVSVSDSSIYVCYVNSNRSCDSEVSTINGNVLIDHKRACIKVCKENNCVTVLCCCVCFLEGCIVNTVYRSNCLYDAECAVTVRYANHVISTVLGNVGSEGTAGDCGSCGKFAAGPSANPNVTVEGTAGYRSCKCACSINAGEVGRTVYNNVAADCNLHTACITVAVEINCINACRVFGNLTAGDIKLTLVSGGVRILKPNLTYDLAAADIDNIIVSSAVCKSTDRAALSCCDCTALNVENCIATVSVGKVVNSELVNVCSSGKALNSTTLDGESSLLVGDCGNCISPSSVSSTVEVVRNLTAAYAIKDSEVAVIFNKSIVLSDLRGNSLAESVAVKIKNDILVDNKSLVKSNVALENDCITVLCRLKRGLDRILAYVVNCGGVRGTSILRHCGEKTYALCAACKLIGVAAVVIVICGVEVVEYTAGNVNLTENALSLVNVKEESHTIVELLSLVATALNVNDTAASCIDCCATVGYEDTVLNSNNRAVDRGNYLNVLAVACCKHSAVTCDSKLRAVLSENNFNYVSVKACCYCATCKVESYVNITVKNNARVKLNVLNESDYVACLCRVDSSLDAGVLNATDLNCRNESVNVRVNVAVTTAGASMCSVTSVCEVRRSYNRIVVMTGSLDNNSFSRKLVAASRAVNYALVVTCYCTGRLNSVLFNCRSRNVNVNNDTVGSVVVCLTIEAVCKIL